MGDAWMAGAAEGDAPGDGLAAGEGAAALGLGAAAAAVGGGALGGEVGATEAGAGVAEVPHAAASGTVALMARSRMR
jgi:hypothetical protein